MITIEVGNILGVMGKGPLDVDLGTSSQIVKRQQQGLPHCTGYIHSEDLYDKAGNPLKFNLMDLLWLIPSGYNELNKVAELGTYEGNDILTQEDVKRLKAEVREGALKQNDFKVCILDYENLGEEKSHTIFCTDIFASKKIQKDMRTAWEGYICEVGKKTRVSDLIPKHSLTKNRKIEQFSSNVMAELQPDKWLKDWILEESKKIPPEELPVSMIEFSPNAKLAAGVTSLWWNDSLLPTVYLALVKKNEEGKKPVLEICKDPATKLLFFERPVGTEEPIRYIV